MSSSSPATIIDNPFVKSENKSWHINPPSSLQRHSDDTSIETSTAAVEAGQVSIDDHVTFFSTKLSAARLPNVINQPRISHQAWLDLYQRNLTDRGHHFVVHQHDHPVAGTHYDLRLQCNATSSISFAIMYGLPGDPNSRRLNRNATETRVHNLWNHLIETASYDTGTMLLWDTGEYSVLPYYPSKTPSNETDDSESDLDAGSLIPCENVESEQQKLYRAFQARKIKLRLHGTKLPPGYTLSLRLTRENNREQQPKPPSFRRRRRRTKVGSSSTTKAEAQAETSDSSAPSSDQEESWDRKSSNDDTSALPRLKRSVSSLHRAASPPLSKRAKSSTAEMAKEQDAPSPALSSDEQTRLENAYPGATNTFKSIHQRKWYLSMDRLASGFCPVRSKQTGTVSWERGRQEDGSMTGFERFHVLGRDHETSVLTGRMAADVAKDEGLIGYKPRGGWRGVTE
ncbi:hypothetical protein B0A52_07905 [Exophiala mesophila]|uniref:DNA ligase D 3'-phosphoesterase domain-containing protein n=1 Tax=Exophiala mesophila TaxID=212818 RepID=A0A438MXL0_EXOME|nr:hypothetical protein B0A52_07905 [Exophiala mesophila]